MKFWFFFVSLLIENYSEGTIMQETLTALATANNEFSLDLLKKLHAGGTNVFFSPLSISAAVAMTSLGARGNTLEEINSAFHFNDVSRNSTNPMAVHEAYKEIITNYKERGSNLGLAIRLFSNNNLDLLLEFLDDVKNYYQVSVESVDFSSRKVEDIINRWVSQHTNNKINDLFAHGSIKSDASLVLANAIYFKENWKHEFFNSNSLFRKFHINSDESTTVMMMFDTNEYPYIKDEEINAQILEMPYNEGNISMIAILPPLGELEDLISNLNIKKLCDILSTLNNTQVRIHVPRFTTDTKYSLGPILNQLGVNELFSMTANLSGMTELTAKVSKIIHKAIIKVNEEGTEAAAATGLDVTMMSLPHYPPVDYPEFIADHPFLFFIVDRSNEDIILFAGVLNRPEYNEVEP